MNYMYIVECNDGTLYTGWTNDLEKRIRMHNSGEGSKYTKSRRPVMLRYFEAFATKMEAQKREWEVKHLTKQQKLALLALNGQKNLVLENINESSNTRHT